MRFMDKNARYNPTKYSIHSNETAYSTHGSGFQSPKKTFVAYTDHQESPAAYSRVPPLSEFSKVNPAKENTYSSSSFINKTPRDYVLEIDGRRYIRSDPLQRIHRLHPVYSPQLMNNQHQNESYIFQTGQNCQTPRNSYYYLQQPRYAHSYTAQEQSLFTPTPNHMPQHQIKTPTPKLKEAMDIKGLTLLFMKLDRAKKAGAAKMRKELIHKLRVGGLDRIVLKNLEPVLLKFLLAEPVDKSDVDSLRVCERILLGAYLVKKKYLDVDTLQMTGESINWFEKRATVKRNEQEYKIILKKAFRALISQFNQNQLKFDGDKAHFYRHHLGEFAQANDLELSSLYLEALFNEKGSRNPSKRKSKKNYAQILRTSPSLMADIKKYLDNKFEMGTRAIGSRRDAEKEIKRKVPDLLNKWKSQLFTQENSPSEQMADFLIKFFTNKKVKLPWSVNEVDRAVVAVKNLLQM